MVIWPKNATYLEVVNMCIHVCNIFSRKSDKETVVVFDGYTSGPSTKDPEHKLRSSKTASPHIIVHESKVVVVNQQSFLNNQKNKDQLIKLLLKHLSHAGHLALQSSGDADVDIAKKALNFALIGETVTVIANDTDIMVLLTYHFRESMGDIFMLTSAANK